MSSPFRERHDTSLAGVGHAKMTALFSALELPPAQRARAAQTFDCFGPSWGDWAGGHTPAWINDIADDCTPFELSVTFRGDQTDLGVLFESHYWPLTPTSTWYAGLDLSERLAASCTADPALFNRVCDVFAPACHDHQRFLLWYHVLLRADGGSSVSAYFDPEIHGPASARILIERALSRLRLPQADGVLDACLQSAADDGSRIPYFSVNLDAEDASAEIYLSADSATRAERLLECANHHLTREIGAWVRTLTGGEGPYRPRPVLVALAFRRGFRAPDVTLHVPIRWHVLDDEEALSRVGTLLCQPNTQRLRKALEAVSGRTLAMNRGALTYVSIKAPTSCPRVTAYLAPEVYYPKTSRRNSYAAAIHPPSHGELNSKYAS